MNRKRLPSLCAPLLCLLVLWLPLSSFAARPILPPLTELTRQQTHVMAARALARGPGSSVVFECVENLTGQSDARMSIRTDAQTLADIELGQTYVLAHSNVISNPQRREEKLIDPKGSRIVSIRGLGTTALFEDLPDIRQLFRTARTPLNKAGEQALTGTLVRLMQRQDARTRTLVIGEFFLREPIRSHVSERQARLVGRVINDPALNAELKSYLVETAGGFDGASEQTWMGDILRGIIDQTGAQVDLATHEPRLLSQSVITLQHTAKTSDEARITALLRSNAPRVVQASIEFLRGLDQALAVRAVSSTIEAAMWDDTVPAHTRRLLEGWLVEQQLAGGNAN